MRASRKYSTHQYKNEPLVGFVGFDDIAVVIAFVKKKTSLPCAHQGHSTHQYKNVEPLVGFVGFDDIPVVIATRIKLKSLYAINTKTLNH